MRSTEIIFDNTKKCKNVANNPVLDTFKLNIHQKIFLQFLKHSIAIERHSNIRSKQTFLKSNMVFTCNNAIPISKTLHKIAYHAEQRQPTQMCVSTYLYLTWKLIKQQQTLVLM